MTLENQFRRCVTARSSVAITLFAILLLPSLALIRPLRAGALANDAVPNAKPSAPHVTSEFAYVIPFEQGATRFLDGDRITITEVRGTAMAFTAGNIYWIKGTYTLASCDRAKLSAYVTATEAKNGRSSSLKVQTIDINRETGDFTLFLPMYYEGLPHVSFYPADGGEGFGGNYFGTGNSVLKKWWGTQEKAQ